MHTAVCPTCQRKVSLPANTTSRVVNMMCPKCGELLPVPPSASRHPDDGRLADLHPGRQHTSALSDTRAEIGQALATTKGLGLFAVLLGLLAFVFLAAGVFCLPVVVGYVGLAPGGIGLLLGLYGIARGLQRRDRDLLLAVGGLATCGLAVGLILTLSTLRRPETPPPKDETPTILEQRKDLK